MTIVTPEEVLLYVPNLIGYARIASTIVSFLLMVISPDWWLLAILLYITSFVGDLFDGLVARKLNQTSDFGGLIDMVTDRCSTLGLLFVLSGDYADIDKSNGFPFFRLVCSFKSSNIALADFWQSLISSSNCHPGADIFRAGPARHKFPLVSDVFNLLATTTS